MPADAPSDLAGFLERARGWLVSFVERDARGLLRHDATDDVVSGIHGRAVEQGGRFEYRSEQEAFAWLRIVARQYIVDRQRYWSALRRQGGHLLRVTVNPQADGSAAGGVDPPGNLTGPVTFALRRERIELAARAVKTLLPRDQELIRCTSEGVELTEIARRLGVSYDAAEQARRRAIERFQRVFALMERGGPA